jgi:predicted transposase YbfD/YdcC
MTTPRQGPPSIAFHFAHVHDPRIDRGKRHVLIDVMTIAILAVICGADSWVGVVQFGKAKETWLKAFLALPNGIPSHDTFGRVFSLLDPEQFAKGFMDWIATLRTFLPFEVIAVDGKTVRGSFDKASGVSAIHMVSAWACRNGILLGQRKIDAKSNEITAIPKLLELLDLHGATVTIDAMGCQRDIAEQIVAQGGDYALALKGNQPSINDEIQMLVGNATAEVLEMKAASSAETVDGDHGRIETRKYWVMDDLSSLSSTMTWPGIQAVGIADRTRDINGKIENERAFYLLSEAMPADRFGWTVRSHWGVENNLHWSLDVSFSEDKSRVRKDNAAENFATVRRLALTLLKAAPSKVGIANRRLRAGWDNDFLLEVVAGQPRQPPAVKDD